MMSGHQFTDAAEEGAVFADVAEGEVFGEEGFLELGGNGGVFEERFDFAGEDECAPVPIVVKGLLAESIAGTEEFARVLVPDCKGEHAAQAQYAFGAILLVGVENGLGVGAGFDLF